MDSSTSDRSELRAAHLRRYGLVSVAGEDARSFLHSQLTSDIEHLPADQARFSGWCSAKGRLLASLLVLARQEGFILQLAADLAPHVAKRLGMFVLRAKVKVLDVGQRYVQLGVWGESAEVRLAGLGVELGQTPMVVANIGELSAVRLDQERILIFGPPTQVERIEMQLGAAMSVEDEWALLDIRSGRALIEQATQDLFIPQMVNLEAVGGVDFKKGCYPGQEIVARAQYRGQIKRRMIRGRLEAQVEARPGTDLYSDDLPGQASGTVVSVAAANGGRELLAVVPIASIEKGAAIRVAPAGPAIDILPLPYTS